MKKIMLTKSNHHNLLQKSPAVVDVLENTNKNMKYEKIKRKAMQPPYQELFQALLRLPDRQVQARVLDAINGGTGKMKSNAKEIVQTCDICKRQKNQSFVDVATQTSFFSKQDLTDNAPKLFEKELPKNDEPLVKKRKHRRKLRVPQVIKKSLTKQLQQQQPIVQKRKMQVVKPSDDVNENHDETSPLTKRQRSYSVSSMDLADVNHHIMLMELQVSGQADEQAIVIQTMLKEYREAEIIQPDGLIPIHSAIMKDDLNCLKRQIYVWKKLKKVDLNELCTEDGEDCLQLAVVQNKSHFFVDVLVKNGLDLNSLDDQSNTLIHLAILNDVDVDVLSSLMEQVDLNMLLKLNDDGFTPLHLTIRQDKFLLAEIILYALDKRCFGQLFHKRENNESKEHFLNFYEKRCEHLEIENSMMKQSKEKQRLKRRLMDAGEMRSGSTALFYAIENKLEHFIYFLLAHFADPRVENHSGQNSRAYLGEFAKTLNLSLKIDRVMEKIENFLEQ